MSVLDLIYLPHPHTGESIANIVWESITNRGLDRKILAITTDNGPKMVNAMKILVKQKNILFHIHCGAHCLQLIVKSAIKCFKDAYKIGNPKDKNESKEGSDSEQESEIQNIELESSDEILEEEEKDSKRDNNKITNNPIDKIR